MGRLRVNLGINDLGFSWYLEPGGVFNTPECLLVRSSEGVGGCSRVMHRIFLDNLIPNNWSNTTPPIVLNSWEAKYFSVDRESIIQLAENASKIGANLVVLGISIMFLAIYSIHFFLYRLLDYLYVFALDSRNYLYSIISFPPIHLYQPTR